MSTANTAKSPGGAGPIAANEIQLADSTADTPEKMASLDTAGREKEIATLVAQSALAGHAVHRGQSGDFLVTRWGLSRWCADFDELQAFARQIGAAP